MRLILIIFPSPFLNQYLRLVNLVNISLLSNSSLNFPLKVTFRHNVQ